MRRYSLSAAVLLAFVAGPLSGCAHTGPGSFAASKAHKVEAQYDIARLAESEGQTDKARQMYEGIYKKNSDNPQVCHRLGIVSAKQGNFEEAKRYFNEAHKLRPTDPEILNDLGYTCFLSNDLLAAEAALDKAMKLDPRNHRATNNLALVVGTQGRLDESYRLFRMVNKEAEAHSNVAFLYAQQGDGKKAMEHYSQALTLDPEMRKAGNAMVEIARLQQKMESDRSTQLANQTQPTPAVQPVADVRLVPTAMPQLNDVIADSRAAQQAPVIEVAAETPIRPAGAVAPQQAAPEIATPATPIESEFDVTESADNPFLPPTTPTLKSASTNVETADSFAAVATPVNEPVAQPAVKVEPVAEVVAEPVAEKAVAVAPAVIGTSTSQTLANIPDDISIPAVLSVDYVKMCPTASSEVKPLLAAMNSNDVSQLKSTLHKIGELNAAGASAEMALRTAMQHSDGYVQVHAALAMWRVTQNTEDTLPVFVAGLKHSDPGVRSFAATALSMGPQVESMIAPLTVALSDSNSFVRLHAAETLYQYRGQEAAATKVIVANLNDKEANVRWLATFILGEIHPESETVVQALAQALKDNDARIRAGAAFALGAFGTQANPALPELKKLTKDAQPDVRKAAEEAVRDIEHSSAQASSN